MGETTFAPIQCFSIEEYYRHGQRYDAILKLPPLANPWTGKEHFLIQTDGNPKGDNMEIRADWYMFEKDGILYVRECEKCENYLLENNYGYFCCDSWCNQKYPHGTEYPIREANDSEIRGYKREKSYKASIEADTTKASQIIGWWGFEMPSEFSVNHGPREYMPYEAYLTLVKSIFPDETPLNKDDFNELVWRIWR